MLGILYVFIKKIIWAYSYPFILNLNIDIGLKNPLVRLHTIVTE